MNKLLIVSKNTFLIEGIKAVLTDELNIDSILILDSIAQSHNISDFDLIVIEMMHHHLGLCMENLKSRKEMSKIFFIQTGVEVLEKSRFLKCCQDAVVITKSESIDDVRKKLRYECEKSESNTLNFDSCCARCNYPYLDGSQLIVLLGIKHEYNTKMLASALNVSSKTIFAQIDRIKDKFGLKSSVDLKDFLSNDLRCNKPISMR